VIVYTVIFVPVVVITVRSVCVYL